MKRGGILSILTKELVKNAVNLVTPVITQLINGTPEKKGIYVVITDPDKPYKKKTVFEKAILWEGSVGEGREFQVFAAGKAQVVWRTGKQSILTETGISLLPEEKDCVWSGSAMATFDTKTLIVAVSGLREHQDGYVAKLILATIELMIAQTIQTLKDNGEGIFQIKKE